MGSHPWKTVTAYDPDVVAALRRAQADVFARGEYGFTYMMKNMYAAMNMPVPPLPPQQTARSIDEAREIAAESGTCSVLDVYEVGDAPGPGVAGPIPPERVRDVVGVDRPSLSELEASLDEFYEALDRGSAAYFVCHENGRPSQYLFIGMSFD
jgi:hypothetical protein